MTLLIDQLLASPTPEVSPQSQRVPSGHAEALLRMALDYAAKGFRVLPLHNVAGAACTCPDPRFDKSPGGARCKTKGKHPRINAWQKQATTDEDTVKGWWRSWPEANVGIAMGGVERLVAIDIDGPVGFESLEALQKQHHLLPVTLTSRSGREDGGEHRIYRVPADWPLVKNEVKFAPGLDVRSEGGQIVAPPSLHESGQFYRWTHAVSVADMPRWLYDIIVAGKSKVVPIWRIVEQVASAVVDPVVHDIAELHDRLREYRRRLPEGDASRTLIEAVLKGQPFAQPGSRDQQCNKLMSVLGFMFHDVSVETVLELLRPSLSKMDLSEGGVPAEGDYERWVFELTDMFQRSRARRAEKEAADKELNDGLLQALQEKRAQLKLAPTPNPFVEGDERASDDGRLVIHIVPGQIESMVYDSIRALAVFDNNIYQRSGELVTIAKEPEKVEAYVEDVREGNDILLREGTPHIYTMTQAMVLERLASVVKWERPVKAKKGKGGGISVETDPHQTTVRLVHERKKWLGIKPLRGVRETPFFAPSGNVITVPGYNEETKVVMLPSLKLDDIPENPTQEDARRELKYLWTECFCDFPYRGMGDSDPLDVTREARYEKALTCPDAFVAIATMLTIFARPAILGAVVGAVFEAAAQGSGKSYQMHIVSMVATGRAASLTALPMDRDGKVNDESFDKTLAAYARAGVPIVAVDNIKGTLGGSALELKQTAPEKAAFRLLGTHDFIELPWSAVFMFSGNNMSMTDDTAQRNMVSRLESLREDPRDRPASSYRHEDILGWVRENRASLVRACIIILRAFFVAEKKPSAGTWGSFEAWSRVVPAAIMYAGGPNVLDSRAKDGASEDAAADAHSVLMRFWPFKEPVRASEVTRKVFEGETSNINARTSPDVLELRGALRALTNTQEGKVPNPTQLGCVLRSLRGKIRNGLQLQGTPARDRSTLWRVIKGT